MVARTEQDLEWCNGRTRNPYVDDTDSREAWAAARRCQAVASRGLCTSLPVAAQDEQDHVLRTTYSTSSSLVFNDDACLIFEGHVRLPIGEDGEIEEVEFEGFKVKNTGSGVPRPWISYPPVTIAKIYLR
jgi:hypothetical protein